MFLGAKRFGAGRQRKKNCLILDRENCRYQAFISDIAGQDIRAHAGNDLHILGIVRNWLSQFKRNLPGAHAVQAHYQAFLADLPVLCTAVPIQVEELTFNDLTNVVTQWLTAKPLLKP